MNDSSGDHGILVAANQDRNEGIRAKLGKNTFMLANDSCENT